MTASQSRKSARRATCLSTGHGRARPDIQPSSQVVRQFANCDATHRPFISRFTAGRTRWIGSNPITHLTPRHSNPHSARRITLVPLRAVSLYGAFFVKEFARAANLWPSSVSLFDLKARSFVPTRTSLASSRAEAVKVGRRTNLAIGSAVTRPHLDSFEHDGTLGAIGMTIEGSPLLGAD